MEYSSAELASEILFELKQIAKYKESLRLYGLDSINFSQTNSVLPRTLYFTKELFNSKFNEVIDKVEAELKEKLLNL